MKFGLQRLNLVDYQNEALKIKHASRLTPHALLSKLYAESQSASYHLEANRRAD